MVRSNINKVPVPGLLSIIARDATYYFMVIFTLHLVLVLFLVFGSVRISLYCMLHHLSTVRSDVYSLTSSYFLQGESHQDAFRSFFHPIFLRAIVGPLCTSDDLFAFQDVGSDPRLRYLPAMITRLLLSLRKANASQVAWSLGEQTTYTTIGFAERHGGVFTRDEMHLETFASTHEGAVTPE